MVTDYDLRSRLCGWEGVLSEFPALALVELSLDGKIVAANDSFCQLLGRSRRQLLGHSPLDFTHPDDRAATLDALSDLSAIPREGRTTEKRHLRGDGSVVGVRVTAVWLPERGRVLAQVLDISDLIAAREATTASARRQAALIEHSSDPILVLDGQGRLVDGNPATEQVIGWKLGEQARAMLVDRVHRDDIERVLQKLADIYAQPGLHPAITFRIANQAGSWVHMDTIANNQLDDPAIRGVIVNGRDVTVRVEAAQVLRASEARYRAIADTAQEGILTVDPGGQTLYANQKLADILGVTLETICASSAPDLLDLGDDGAFIAEKLRTRQERGAEQYEVTYPHPDGHERVLRLSASPLRDDNGATGSLAMITDISDERRAEQELRRRALYDELTGLPNRSLLTDRLDQAVARSQRSGGSPVAVLLADLDQFKLINESWGHDAGDRLLVAVTERLTGAAKASDTVARFGEDEFVIIREGASETEAEDLADELLQALADPFDLAGQRSYVTASVGIAVSPPCSGEELLRFADAAMTDARARGRGRAQLFDPSRAEEANGRLSLSNDLREALVNEELTLHYQPLLELATGRVLGVEALARWDHPTRGPIPPTQFVALAEATGLAQTLDRWALGRACRDLGRLRECTDPSLRVSVNLSATHLADADLEQTVLSTLRENGLECNALELEITESAIMNNPEHAREFLQRLRARGVSIAIDDFGTGYSSHGYLSRLPATTVKIDRMFIRNITDDPDALAIVSSIIDLCRAMRLTTVAEGIETVEQLTLLRRLGCTAGQGFLWSPALPVGEFVERLSLLPNRRFDVTRFPKFSIAPNDNGLGSTENLSAEDGPRASERMARGADDISSQI